MLALVALDMYVCSSDETGTSTLKPARQLWNRHVNFRFSRDKTAPSKNDKFNEQSYHVWVFFVKAMRVWGDPSIHLLKIIRRLRILAKRCVYEVILLWHHFVVPICLHECFSIRQNVCSQFGIRRRWWGGSLRQTMIATLAWATFEIFQTIKSNPTPRSEPR